jgi:hypothetical protein
MPDKDPPQEMLNIEHPITNVKVNHAFGGGLQKNYKKGQYRNKTVTRMSQNQNLTPDADVQNGCVFQETSNEKEFS